MLVLERDILPNLSFFGWKRTPKCSDATLAQLQTVYNARSCPYCTIGYLGPCRIYLGIPAFVSIHPSVAALNLAPSIPMALVNVAFHGPYLVAKTIVPVKELWYFETT